MLKHKPLNYGFNIIEKIGSLVFYPTCTKQRSTDRYYLRTPLLIFDTYILYETKDIQSFNEAFLAKF
ncbi:hypothetical protein ACU8KH_04019 [Lachancea thermotolerans]